jgi:putative ABC transport system permease protein
VPGIKAIEAWSGAEAKVLDENGTVLDHIRIAAPPAGSTLIDPEVTVGRWLLPGDDRAIVVSEAIRTARPGIQPGDTLRLRVSGGREEEWTVVGMFSFPSFVGDPLAHVPPGSLSVPQQGPEHAATFRLVIRDPSEEGQKRIGAALGEHLRAGGFNVRAVEPGAELKAKVVQAIGILVVLLLAMALLTATVGSIGLTGSMSLNVLERTREIGVLRAIGAVDSAIIKSVVIESAFVGLISWFIAVPLSFPISALLLTIVSSAMGIGSIPLTFSLPGTGIWLGVVLGLTVLASAWPARSAARLTIREVLAYA